MCVEKGEERVHYYYCVRCVKIRVRLESDGSSRRGCWRCWIRVGEGRVNLLLLLLVVCQGAVKGLALSVSLRVVDACTSCWLLLDTGSLSSPSGLSIRRVGSKKAGE